MRKLGPMISRNETNSNATATSIRVPCAMNFIRLFMMYPEISIDSVIICTVRFNDAINWT